ncbi:hypothetical protein [Chryseobacterium pennae]|uniref:hypothetical protein n=1 Tax=Chryseobacterium pennae TaxID=2258962 RepID=UPI001403B3EE|nr:hypothetical protein [Chryseobacterium pennae]
MLAAPCSPLHLSITYGLKSQVNIFFRINKNGNQFFKETDKKGKQRYFGRSTQQQKTTA